MAGDNMKITLTIDTETKSLVKAEQQLKKTSKAANKTSKSYKETEKSAGQYHKREKGVASAGANTTKNFSKMKQTMGSGSSGLVGAYATLAANVFAATAAFTALRAGAQTEQLVQGLEAVGAASGRNLGALAQRVREAADGALSLDQALRTAATGASANFDDSQLLGLTRVAKGAALALGRDVGDAQDRLVRGAAKLEPEILDELGIFVRLDDAAEKYAAAIGKTASELTRFQKGQAFTNEIITQGTQKFSEIADKVDPNPYDKLAATLTDLSRNFLNLINSVLGPFANLLANNQVLLAGFFMIITKGVISAALPALAQMSKKMAALGFKIKESAEQEVRSNKAAQKAIVDKQKLLGTGFAKYDKVIIKMKQEKISIQEIRGAQQDLHEYIKKNQFSQKKFIQDRVNLAKQESAALDDLIEKRRSLEATSIDTQKRASAEGRMGSRGSRILGELDKPGKGGFAGYKKAFKEADIQGKIFRRRIGKINAETRANTKHLTGWKKAMAGTKLALKSTGGAFKSFGLTAKVAMKGIFTAIPVIGQVLFALDLLIVALKKAFSWMGGLIPEQSALSKAQDGTATAMENVKNATSASNMASKTYSEQLVISSTAVDQLSTSYATQVEASEKLTKKTSLLSAIFTSFGELFRRLGRGIRSVWGSLLNWISEGILSIKITMLEFMTENRKWINAISKIINWTKEKGDVGWIDIELMTEQSEEALALAKRTQEEMAAERAKTLSSGTVLGFDSTQMEGLFAIETILKGTGEAAAELESVLGTGAGGVNDFVAQIEREGSVYKALSEDFKQQIVDRKKYTDAMLQEMTTQKLLSVILEEGQVESKKLGDAIKNLSSITQNEGIKIDKFLTSLKPKGATSSVATVFEDIKKSMNDLYDGKGTQAVTEQFNALTDNAKKMVAGFSKMDTDWHVDQQNSIKAVKKEMEELGETHTDYQRLVEQLEMFQKNLSKDILDSTNLAANLLARMAEAEIFLKTEVKTLDRKNKLILKIGKNTAAGIKQSVTLTNKMANAQLAAQDDLILAQKVFMGMNTKAFQKRQRLNKLTDEDLQAMAQLKTLEEGRADILNRLIGPAEKRLMIQETELANQKILNSLTKLQAEGQLKMLKVRMKIGNIAGGRGGQLNAKQEFEMAQKASQLAIESAEITLELEKARFEVKMKMYEIDLVANGQTLTQAQEITRELKSNFALQQEIGAEKIKQMKEAKTFAGLGFGGGIGNMAGAVGSDLMAAQNAVFKGQLNTKAIKDSNVDQFSQLDARIATGDAAAQDLDMNDDYAIFLMELGTRASEQKAELISEEQSALFQARVSAMNEAVQPMLASLRQLGPEGELAASIGQGMFTISSAFEVMVQGTDEMADRLAMAAVAIQSISAIMAAAGKAAIAAIDKQIAAEKARDGKSAESVNKLKALEAKKDAMARKNFERNKKMQIASAIASTAAAVAGILAADADKSFAVAVPLAMLVGAMGMAQVAIIRKQQYQGGSGDVGGTAPPSITIGKRSNKVDVSQRASAGELAYLKGDRGIGTNANNFIPGNGAAGLRKGYASGGVVVGERGPEVVQPTTPFNVIPNDALGGKMVEAHITINAIDARGVEEVLQEQQGNIIGMIRSAANDYGEEFLESVETDYLEGGTPRSAGGIDY